MSNHESYVFFTIGAIKSTCRGVLGPIVVRNVNQSTTLSMDMPKPLLPSAEIPAKVPWQVG